MMIPNVKSLLAKVATVGLVAGVMAIAAPAKANAQVSFGVRVGPPVVYGHYGPAYGYYGRPYGYGYGYHPYYRPYAYGYRRGWR